MANATSNTPTTVSCLGLGESFKVAVLEGIEYAPSRLSNAEVHFTPVLEPSAHGSVVMNRVHHSAPELSCEAPGLEVLRGQAACRVLGPREGPVPTVPVKVCSFTLPLRQRSNHWLCAVPYTKRCTRRQ